MIAAALRETREALRQAAVRRQLALGVALAAGLLAFTYAAVLLLADGFDPETLTLPGIGRITDLGTLLSPQAILFALGLSVLTMPLAAAPFAALHLRAIDAAADGGGRDATGAHLGPAIAATLAMAAALLGTLMLIPALSAWAFVALWAAGGAVLGRAYAGCALRGRGRDAAGARDLLAAQRWRLWLSGTVFAALLSVPLVNLAVPGLGALFFGRLARAMDHSAG